MKKKMSVLLLTMIMILAFSGIAFATDVDVHGYYVHTGWSPDYGAKSFRVDYIYTGNQYCQSGDQYVDGHDCLMFSPTIYPPEIDMGSGSVSSVKLLNTSGSTVSTLSGYNSGLIRSYWYSGTTLLAKYSYNWLYKSPDASYRVKATYMYSNSEFSIYSTRSYYTNYF
jgi:hypothetical protein